MMETAKLVIQYIDSNYDSSDIENEIVVEAMLIDGNIQNAKIARIMAPTQNKTPVSYNTPHVDALCNPNIFVGEDFIAKKLSYTKRIESEAQRSGIRSCENVRLLYMAKQKLERDL